MIRLCRTFNYYPMKMGDFVTIGRDCIIEAAQIGSGTEIEDNCIIVRPTTSFQVSFDPRPQAHPAVATILTVTVGRIRHHQRLCDHRRRHRLVPKHRLSQSDPMGWESR